MNKYINIYIYLTHSVSLEKPDYYGSPVILLQTSPHSLPVLLFEVSIAPLLLVVPPVLSL